MSIVAQVSDRLKLAAYLDEAGDDPTIACATLKQHNIHYAVLRNAWNNDISKLNDQSLKKLRTTLEDNNISVVAIISDLGKVETSHLPAITNQDIAAVFNLASYFQANFVRIHAGVNSKTANDAAIDGWVQTITKNAVSAGIVPLYEITSESAIQEPTDVARMLSKSVTWRLLYDPVQLIIKRNQNPFAKYWTLLQQFVGAVDIRDYKIGFGFKPAGFGDSMIKHVIKDDAQYWYFLEPSLGRRHASANTRAETFKMAIEALENLLQ